MSDIERKEIPILYAIGLVSFILCFMEIEVSWSYPMRAFKYLSLATITVHLLLWLRNYSSKQLLFIILALFIVGITGYNSHQLDLLYLSFALVIGAKDIDFFKILKVCFITGFVICLISIIGSWVGLIENKAYHISIDTMDMMGADSTKRYCYGYAWPTDCANHISFLSLVYWLKKGGLLNMIEMLLFIFAFWFVFEINKTRQASLIILIMILLSIYLKYLERRQRIPSKLFLKILVFSIPFCAALSLFTTLAYDEGDLFWVAVDLVFSTRLSLGLDAIEQYGIPWLGQYILMVGADAGMMEYNYVDSSYLQAYLLWGIVLTTILIIIFVKINYSAYKRKDYVFLFAVLLAGLSGISSQFLFQIYFCPLLLALFAQHSNRNLEYN